MVAKSLTERIQERERTRINKLIDEKIESLKTQAEEEKKSQRPNWWWVDKWEQTAKILEEVKEEIDGA